MNTTIAAATTLAVSSDESALHQAGPTVMLILFELDRTSVLVQGRRELSLASMTTPSFSKELTDKCAW